MEYEPDGDMIFNYLMVSALAAATDFIEKEGLKPSGGKLFKNEVLQRNFSFILPHFLFEVCLTLIIITVSSQSDLILRQPHDSKACVCNLFGFSFSLKV